MSQRKRILVTGGAGFIGSHVADAFLAAGLEVAVVDNLSAGIRESAGRRPFHPFDIKTADTFDLICRWRPHVLVHHAAQMSVRVSVGDPMMDAQENILGSLNLFEAAAKARPGEDHFCLHWRSHVWRPGARAGPGGRPGDA